MNVQKKNISTKKLVDAIVEGMKEKKAKEIVVMDMRQINNAIADFLIICSGQSDKQLDAISSSVEEEVFKKIKENPWQIEGKQNKEWLILDYVSVIAHIFREDRRVFYALEKLWGDAHITPSAN